MPFVVFRNETRLTPKLVMEHGMSLSSSFGEKEARVTPNCKFKPGCNLA